MAFKKSVINIAVSVIVACILISQVRCNPIPAATDNVESGSNETADKVPTARKERCGSSGSKNSASGTAYRTNPRGDYAPANDYSGPNEYSGTRYNTGRDDYDDSSSGQTSYRTDGDDYSGSNSYRTGDYSGTKYRTY